MRRLRSLAPALAVAAAVGLSGWSSCAGRAPAPVPCEPAAGELAAGARAAALAGEFRLTLTATGGARAGQSTTGTLSLQPYGTRPAPVPATPTASYPLYGAARLDLSAVGALSAGDITGDDPSAPGVLGIEWRESEQAADRNRVTLRLGADANRGGPPRFDGAHMALHLTSLSADRFAGRWQSGGGPQQAEGYFCAERSGAAR